VTIPDRIVRLRSPPAAEDTSVLDPCRVNPDSRIELNGRGEIEIMPPTQAKMEEYSENGVRLGWLLNPEACQVVVYHPGQPVNVFENLESIAGDPELRRFLLDLQPIRDPGF
jgi:Uma2 family endonuclease